MDSKSVIQTPRKVLRIKQVAAKFGMGVSTVWWHLKHNVEFPRAFKLGPRTTVIYEDQADAYLARCADKRVHDAIVEAEQ